MPTSLVRAVSKGAVSYLELARMLEDDLQKRFSKARELVVLLTPETDKILMDIARSIQLQPPASYDRWLPDAPASSSTFCRMLSQRTPYFTVLHPCHGGDLQRQGLAFHRIPAPAASSSPRSRCARYPGPCSLLGNANFQAVCWRT